jgi:hypothetical protein
MGRSDVSRVLVAEARAEEKESDGGLGQLRDRSTKVKRKEKRRTDNRSSDLDSSLKVLEDLLQRVRRNLALLDHHDDLLVRKLERSQASLQDNLALDKRSHRVDRTNRKRDRTVPVGESVELRSLRGTTDDDAVGRGRDVDSRHGLLVLGRRRSLGSDRGRGRVMADGLRALAHGNEHLGFGFSAAFSLISGDARILGSADGEAVGRAKSVLLLRSGNIGDDVGLPSSEKSGSSSSGSSSSSSRSRAGGRSAGNSLEEVAVEQNRDSECDDDPFRHDRVTNEPSPLAHKVVEENKTVVSSTLFEAVGSWDGDPEVDGRRDVGDEVSLLRVNPSKLGEDGRDSGREDVDSVDRRSRVAEGMARVSTKGGGLGESSAEVEDVEDEEGDDLKRQD